MKKQTPCPLCNLQDPTNIVYQTKHWKIILSFYQSYLGTCLIILKRHCGDLAELNKTEWGEFIGLVKKMETTLQRAFDTTMFNFGCFMNTAYREKNPQPHVHWYIHPRYNHDVKVNSEIFKDPEFGDLWDVRAKRRVSEQTKKIIIDKIKKNLERD